MLVRISMYLAVIVVANLLVNRFGQPGLLISSALLIPFDFVIRCYFHERWKGYKLVRNLGILIGLGALTTFLINHNALMIALGSCAGFVVANIVGGLFYQATIKQRSFVKVNGSDFVAIIADSIVFQLVAFANVDARVMLGQIAIKIVGGLFWYWILFKVIKMDIQRNEEAV